MKKALIILFCLLLCVPLHGCGGETEQTEPTPAESAPSESVLPPERETEHPSPQLDTDFPVPSLDDLQSMLFLDTLLSAEDITPPEMLEQTGMRLLYCTRQIEQEEIISVHSEVNLLGFYLLLGPNGCAPLRTFYSFAEDPLWADLDGDGTAELVYQTPGPTSGLYTEAFWAYGLEDGFPVLKAFTILNLNWSNTGHLEQDDNRVVFVYAGERYTLAIEENRIVFPEGLPEEASAWGGAEWGLVGASLARVRELFADLIVLDTNCCVIWRVPGGSADGSPEVFAALSNNWQTVSDLVSFRVGADGKLGGWRPMTPLIKTPTDLNSLIGLSVDELEEQLGPWHFDSGSGLYLLGWFTEDGLLLQVSAGSTVSFASLYDPMKNEVIESTAVRVVDDISLAP